MSAIDQSYHDYLLIKMLEDHVIKLESVTTLPKPVDLYYAVQCGPAFHETVGWNYNVTGFTVADLRKTVELLKRLAKIDPQRESNPDPRMIL